jgi:hypothetical protein
MNRRECTLIGGTAAWPLTASAQRDEPIGLGAGFVV